MALPRRSRQVGEDDQRPNRKIKQPPPGTGFRIDNFEEQGHEGDAGIGCGWIWGSNVTGMQGPLHLSGLVQHDCLYACSYKCRYIESSDYQTRHETDLGTKAGKS